MLSRRRFLFTAAATAPALALQAQETPPAKTPAIDALPPAIAALTDRRKDIVPITVEERESRLDLARELMKQYKIDGVLITTGAGLRYFTGASLDQSERLFAYVIPVSAAPFIVCPRLERDHLADILLAFPERETTLSYLWQENEDPFDLLKRGLAEANLASGSLGIEEHTQFGFSNAIGLACPALKMVSATPVTAGCRSLKSSAEIALLRLANAITYDVSKALFLSCAPGDTNVHFSELAAKAYARCGVTGEASCETGAASAILFGANKTQTIRERDMLLIDSGCAVEGYKAIVSRSFVYGSPTDFQREIFDDVHNAQSIALAAAHPGVEMQTVDAAARGNIDKAGYGPGYTYFLHRTGHGMGLDLREWPYLVGGNTQKLTPGMLFTNEPAIYLPGKFGIRLCDAMLITDKGAELLTAQSPSLQDPFGIAAQAVPIDAKPVDSKPEDKAATPQKS
jgi:Xaa-Pro dipeptidase